jgi:RNA polymerase sigma-70 factor (ECF subfamily)
MTHGAPLGGLDRGELSLAPHEPARRAVIPLPIADGDEALVASLRAKHPSARAALFDRHGRHVRRVLVRVLGVDQEVPDLLHDVFVTALTTIAKLEDPRALRAWLTSITVHHARGLIRKRSRRRILRFFAPEELDQVATGATGSDAREAVRALYRLLDVLSADERIVFALRFMEGMDLYEVAAACRVSRATVSRRLQRAEQKFVEAARHHDLLRDWLEQGARWSQ